MDNIHTKYDIQEKGNRIVCRLSAMGVDDVCRCTVSVNESANIWRISSWFTKSGFGNKGFGRAALEKALQRCMDRYGDPEGIEYTWNGENAYVLAWLERHFDAVCICSVAVQKTQPDDDWDSHIYELDKEKVLQYFKIGKDGGPIGQIS